MITSQIRIEPELSKLVAVIKRARATLMCHSGPSEVVILHRKYKDFEHSISHLCGCGPVVISQTDYRPSLYFAKEVLYPVLH